MLTPGLILGPRGDGHPVLVLPGWRASDLSTIPLRSYLWYLGYDVHGWNLGRNGGITQETIDRTTALLEALAGSSRQTVSIIGWSLGGTLACDVARRRSRIVRQVITLGSPLLRPDAVVAPLTSIYSRQDRVVSWRRSRVRETATHHNLEVRGGHVGLGHNPTVLHAVADRLAKVRPTTVKRFTADKLWRSAYPTREGSKP